MRSYRLTLVLLLIIIAGTPLFAKTKVIVSIEGLVSISDTIGIGSPRPKRLYLMDANNAAAVHHVVPHIGVILAEDDYKTTVLDGRTRHEVGTGNNLHHWVELTGAEQVSVKNSSTDPLSYDETAPATLCLKPEDQKSLYFLPRLSRVSRKNDGTRIDINDLDPAYLTPKKADRKIAAFMEVTFGSLKAEVRSPIVWAFKDSPKSIGAPHQQLIAHKLIWSFEIEGDTLVLQTSTEGGTLKDFLALKADSDGEILFTLGNAPDEPEELGVKLLAGIEILTAFPPIDHHFALYYEYLKKGVKHDGKKPYVRYIPVASGVCTLNSTTNLYVLDTDPCVLRRFVSIPDPGNCPPFTPVSVGGVNCGPDGLP